MSKVNSLHKTLHCRFTLKFQVEMNKACTGRNIMSAVVIKPMKGKTLKNCLLFT